MTDELAKPKLLVLEMWGLGDLTFSTGFLRAAAERYRLTVLGKPHAEPLLRPTFPNVEFLSFNPPWTAYRGKYRLWAWPWREMFRLIRRLRRERFQVAVSVRNDPRDHLLMRLAGARVRVGFPTKGSGLFLNRPVRRADRKQHKVDDWRQIGAALSLPGAETAVPFLDPAAGRTARSEALLAGVTKPLLVLHAGARIPVRRWPLPYFESILRRLRETFDFHLALIPDPDGHGAELAPLADQVLPALALGELVHVLGRADWVWGNDSGPGHLAAACGRPVVVMFGPTDPDWFRPFGEQHRVIIRDICEFRPCFDYCQFPEPYCLTKLLPDDVWPEIRGHVEELIARGLVTDRLRKRGAA